MATNESTTQSTGPSTAQATQPTEVLAVERRAPREVRVVEDESAISFMMDTAKFEHCYRIAKLMAQASLIPKHLRGETPEQTAANCFLIVNQALRWQFDPFAIAPETYEVGGKLGFQGKLVAAVINARAGLEDKLSYSFSGKDNNLTVTVSGRIRGEAEPRTVTVSVAQARTSNQMWTKDPEQKLVYTGAIKWARRHTPEIIMGVLTDDDLDAIKDQTREEKRLTVVKAPQLAQTFGGAESGSSPEPKHKPTDPPAPPSSSTTPEPESAPEPEQPKDTEPALAPQEGKPQPPDENPDGDLGPQGDFVRRTGESEELNEVRYLMHKAGVSEAQVIAWSRKNSMAKEGQKLADLSTAKHKTIISAWPNKLTEIRQA